MTFKNIEEHLIFLSYKTKHYSPVFFQMNRMLSSSNSQLISNHIRIKLKIEKIAIDNTNNLHEMSSITVIKKDFKKSNKHKNGKSCKFS